MRLSGSNKKSAALFLLLTCFFLQLPTAQAAVPKLLTYQGVLKNGSGSFLTGTYSIVFRIYSASSGGSALWTETQSSVSASSGKFSVQLGSVTALTLDFNADYWLSIQVGADGEMSPRVRLTSMGYGIRSDYENNGYTQTQHDTADHKSIEGVKDNSVNIAKTNFKLDAYSLAAANSLGDLIMDTFNDATGINAGASSNYTYRGTPNYDVTLTPTGGSSLQSCTSSCDGTNNSMLGANTSTYAGQGQKFQIASTKTVDRATFKWYRVGTPSGNVRIRLYSNNAGIPGTLLAESANIPVSAISTSATEVTATFTPTSLTASTDYHIVLENYNGSGDGSNYLAIRSSTSDVVSGVMVWKNSGGTWSAQPAGYGDIYFNVYEQQTYSGTATVVSNAYAEPVAPTTALVVADETLGTGGITYSVSRDNGTTWTTCTKEVVTSISSQPSGTQLKWKAAITGNAELNSIAVAV